MRLSELLTILDLRVSTDGIVTNLTSNSKNVGPGSVFVAVPGTQVDGHRFLAEAERAGALLLIGEKSAQAAGATPEKYLQVPDSRLALGLLASQIEGNPSREMVVIGITGTSGKTTTSYLVESILAHAGKKVGLIGTVAYRIAGKEIPSTHTTPGPVELHQLLRQMRDVGCDAVVMEVSSHALKQSRAAGVAFDGAIFTNLSPEHLDYHPNMADYYASKRILFAEQSKRARRWGKRPVFAFHTNSPEGARLLVEFPEGAGFSVPNAATIDANGIRGIFSGIAIESKLVGGFNAENIAGAVALAKELRLPDISIRAGVLALERIPGRLESVPDPRGRIVLVDYAHKPDALEKALAVLRPLVAPGAKLICVFGCGGDRDRAKRPVMGEIACRLADRVVLTDDNPRTEDPAKILDEIEAGCFGDGKWERIPDRRLAIERSLREANPGDVVLIAGKGHENYQIVGTTKFHFDDREIAERALGEHP